VGANDPHVELTTEHQPPTHVLVVDSGNVQLHRRRRLDD
jgi:hypothetical protein